MDPFDDDDKYRKKRRSPFDFMGEDEFEKIFEEVEKMFESSNFKDMIEEMLRGGASNKRFVHGFSLNIGPDGKPLIATDHPIDTGVQSNTLPNQVPFSEAALEALCIAAKTALDLNGNLINLETELLVIHPNLEMEAERILNSVARVATANNDLNALRARGKFPKGFISNPYLGNPNSYFIKTDAQDGLKHKERMPITIAEDSAFDSKVDKYTATFRDVFGWSNYLGLFGAGFY